MKKWAEQFEQVPTSGNLSSQLESKLSSIHLIDDLSVFSYKALQKGWALKVPKRAPRFPDKVRNYLQEKFDIGNTTGHKSDPVQVSVDTRCARDEQGRRLFTASECLQAQQIRSFFSRLAAAKRANVQNSANLKEKDIYKICRVILKQSSMKPRCNSYARMLLLKLQRGILFIMKDSTCVI